VTDQPLVSIIIPTYNRAHLIGETLDSVLAQTYQNWECIVVDDGSTDNTDEVMANYMAKDDRIQYHHRPDDRLSGGNAARNFGVEVSRGAYINFLDSDDFFHPRTIEFKLRFMLHHNCDIVISQHTKVSSNLCNERDSGYQIFKSNKFDIDFILSRNQILIGDPLIMRNLFKSTKFDENLKRGQDHDFFIRLFQNPIKYCLLNSKLYLINITPKSITVNAGSGDKNMIMTQILIHKKMIRHYYNVPEVVYEYERKTRKMYKSLLKKNKFCRILEHYHFYRKCYRMNNIEFALFFLYNTLRKKGFDKMKKNIS
jgi:glycosyltransferase involved in cell wall biosynthesis